ncbi:MAG: hypothetical protein NUW01_05145 [Gemmatimonadaceae bacterium]|nr:hypothetical protein [Gemmatimonadaceae bacterium]
MAFPSISDVTEAVKATFGASEQPTAEPEVPTTASEEQPDEVTTTQDEEPAAPVETSPDPTAIAQFIDKDAKSFFESLPDATKEALRPVVNRKYYDTENAKTRELNILRAQVADIPTLVQKVVADQFDVIRMEAMSEDERKAFVEKKEVAALRAKAKEAEPKLLSPIELRDVFAQTPLAPAFWEAVKEAGLPEDPNNPEVNAFFNDVLREFPRTTSADHGIQVIRDFSQKYRKAKQPKESDVEALIAKQVAERVEAEVQKRLKGTLKADTGRPGASAGTTQPKTYAEARKGAEELLRAEQR